MQNPLSQLKPEQHGVPEGPKPQGPPNWLHPDWQVP
jgi:hypothetical protein